MNYSAEKKQKNKKKTHTKKSPVQIGGRAEPHLVL